MKKNKIFFTFCLLLTFAFCSCGQKSYLDETGCYTSFEKVKKVAKKSNKPILAIFTQEEGEENGGSKYFVQNILENKDFIKYCSKHYELYKMDFSQKSFQKAAINENDTKKQIEQAQEYSNHLQEAIKLVQYIGFSYTPAFYIFTKDGYFVSEVLYTEDALNTVSFCSILDTYLADVESMQHLVDATEKGTDEEKLNAIDAIYEITPQGCQYLLSDFAKKAVEIDGENKTGRIGLYYFYLIDEKATAFYASQDMQNAIKTYLDAAQSGKLEDDYVQQCYYMCAWVLESIGAQSEQDVNQIIDYLNKALSASPNSLYATDIQNAIEYYKTLYANVGS